MKKLLKDFTEKEYNTLKATGMFWEFYPEATGVYRKDCIVIGIDNWECYDYNYKPYNELMGIEE